MTLAEPALLVTTALEETWGTDEHLLFLGDWCKRYERRHVWGAREHQTVRFHWDDRDKLNRDYDYLKSLHHSLLGCLASSLNELHEVRHTVRYWQILLDPWLMAWVGVVYDRWECLRIAFEEHGELDVVLPEEPVVANLPLSYFEFVIQASTSDSWNLSLYKRILERTYSDRGRFRNVEVVYSGPPGRPQSTSSKRRNLLRRIAVVVDQCLGKFPLKNDIVFMESFFGHSALIRLNLALGQVPRWYLSEFKFDETSVSLLPVGGVVADRAGMSLGFRPESSFEEFINESIVDFLPRCFVEAYVALRERANAVPIKAKAIVTANAHWHNAPAKAWMAEQVSSGVKLVILEHGGSLPARKALFDFEEDISDVKGTWFLPHHQKHVRVPPSKLLRPGSSKLARLAPSTLRNYCVIIANSCPRYVFRAQFDTMAAQCFASLEQVITLYAGLQDDIKKAFRVKPVPLDHDEGWNTRQRYSDILGPQHVLPEQSIAHAFQSARVVVCTYPQTTFSEAMASGMPTVLIYPDRINERHPATLPLLQVLRSANVVFHDPVLAAAHINAVWKDPVLWWNSPTVLHARAEFRRQATDLDSDWLKQWTRFVREVIV